MQYLFQSAFLQSLGYAIANSLWQTALVWFVYSAVSLVPRLSSAVKYRVAVLAQVTGFIWFLLTFRFYYAEYTHLLQSAAGGNPSVQPYQLFGTHASLYGKIISWMVKGELLLPYISLAYLLLITFLCIRWILGYHKTQKIRRDGIEKMPAHWRLFVQKTAEQLGIQKKVQVFLSHTVSSPLTVGFWKPVILVPLASINHLSTAQMEAVLLHELAHIRRWDYIMNLFLSVVEISLFFNPFTQLIGKNIHKERENSCDDWVLQFQYEASDYAKALLCIATLQQTPLLAMAATGKKNELLVRVKRMIGQPENRFNYRRQLMALVIITGMLSSIAWLTPMPAGKPVTSAAVTNRMPVKSLQRDKTTVTEPMAVTVDNPLFNPVFFLSKPLKAEINKNLREAKQEIAASLNQTPDAGLEVMQSLPGLVAGALEQAGNEIEKTKLSGEESFMAEPVKQFFTLFKQKADSSSLSDKIRISMQQEIGKLDKKKINEDIRNAKAEMEKAMKEISLSAGQKKQMKQDIAQAMQHMDDLKKLDLESIILKSLDAASQAISGEKKETLKKQAAHSVEKDEEPSEEPISPARIQQKSNTKDMVMQHIPVMLKPIDPLVSMRMLDSLAQQSGINPMLLLKLKWLLMQQNKKWMRTLNVNYMPAVNTPVTDSLTAAQQIVIQLQ